MGERDERDAPLETALELLGGLGHNRVQRCQMQLTVLVDGHVLDTINISCELGKQFIQTLASTVEVVSRRASEGQARLARFLELGPVLSGQQIAFERLITTAAEHVQVA